MVEVRSSVRVGVFIYLFAAVGVFNGADIYIASCGRLTTHSE
jgi:hypothetical protein